MRGIARTAAPAATRDIAEAPALPVQLLRAGGVGRAHNLAAPAPSSVELETDETRSGGGAYGSGGAPGPSFRV
jgi:hypothetical protein